MKRWIGLAIAITVLGATACNEEKKASEDSPASSAATAKPEEKKGGTGLDHPDNNPEVVKLAKAALECGWQGSGLKSDCEGNKAFTKADVIKDGKGDATLLNMLEDGKKEVRWLAAKGLDHGMNAAWRKDKAAAKRVLAAASAETEEKIGYGIGRLVGMLDLKETGAADDVKKLLAESKSVEVRKGLVSNVLFNNRDEGNFYDLLAETARKHENKEIRKAAAAAFWIGGSSRKDDTCKLWLELASDSDNDVSGHSAYHCSWWSSGGGCTDQWDGLLDTIERRAKDGKVESTFMTSALSWLQQQKKASDAQKKRAIAVAKIVVENDQNGKMARSDALRIIGKEDPAGKAYAKKFADDKEFFVKSAAKRIIDGK